MTPEPTFPLLGFWSAPDEFGLNRNERIRYFSEPDSLRRAPQRELRSGDLTGMLLVDNAGRCWIVRDVRSVGFRTAGWHRVLMRLMRQAGYIEHAVEYRLEAVEPLSLPEVRARVCESITRNAADWDDIDGELRDAEEPFDLEKVLAVARAAVERATNVEEIFDGLDEAWPY